jgi:hypothetical protein
VTLNREKLCAMYEDILMRVALADIARDEARALEACATDDPPDPRAIRAIGRAVRRAKIEKFTRRTLPRRVCGAAWILLAVYLALTVALAADAGARARLLSWMERAAPLRVGAELDPGGAQRDGVPAEWTEKYYPAYIPEGWTLEAVDPALGDVVYRKDADHILQFGVYEGDARHGIRLEGARISRVGVRGATALAAENLEKGFTWVTWQAEGWTIVIYVDADLDTALKVAASVCEVGAPGK